ncbi:uncharacterized protein PGTG_19880 [Puccinia graminis f. sp. tritici CRL 75-36-700-3]|uniref:Uncharacterized protein n=1 Tax=Puccinia graminis f. sp. tritici (strain CRL 75-36-700-3 / race SCCL) TaxID=418459 RepID=E3LBM5_PUCGT|nr:uncharacterized protein PGTG_19880 [Puccinia graminis f. sp. tritici CRL 75-36-700-3]EFP93950.1 hypothetical protein PGTG_19880 [Puccinia graminis f. sp. tritici CRL 75-36-700-3]
MQSISELNSGSRNPRVSITDSNSAAAQPRSTDEIAIGGWANRATGTSEGQKPMILRSLVAGSTEAITIFLVSPGELVHASSPGTNPPRRTGTCQFSAEKPSSENWYMPVLRGETLLGELVHASSPGRNPPRRTATCQFSGEKPSSENCYMPVLRGETLLGELVHASSPGRNPPRSSAEKPSSELRGELKLSR